MIYLSIYFFMLVFDLSVIAGAAYLVNEGWSGWWFLLAIIICGGSNPNKLIYIMKTGKMPPETDG